MKFVEFVEVFKTVVEPMNQLLASVFGPARSRRFGFRAGNSVSPA